MYQQILKAKLMVLGLELKKLYWCVPKAHNSILSYHKTGKLKQIASYVKSTTICSFLFQSQSDPLHIKIHTKTHRNVTAHIHQPTIAGRNQHTRNTHTLTVRLTLTAYTCVVTYCQTTHNNYFSAHTPQ